MSEVDPKKPALRGCFVAPPYGEGALWRDALTVAAAEAGIVVALDDAEYSDATDVIYLRDTVQDIAVVSPTTLVVFLTGIEASDPRRALSEMSAIVGLATMKFSDADFILPSAGDNPATLTLFSRLSVACPSMAVLAGARWPATVHPALAVYSRGKPAAGAAATWDLPVLYYEDKAANLATRPGELHLAGRARCLVYGPYITLPEGLWRITIRFTVDAPAAERKFRFEWGGTTDFAQLTFEPGKPGMYMAQLQHAWTSLDASELRLILPESSLGGILQMDSVEIDMVPGPAASGEA